MSLSPYRFGLACLAAVLVASGAAPARAAESSIDGIWETPLGRVRLEQSSNGVVGKLIEPGRACGFERGADVVRGHIVDDLFTGELRVCYPPRCRDLDGWLFALAAFDPERDKLAGATGATGACQNIVSRGKPFFFIRQRPGQDRPAAGGGEAAAAPAPKPSRGRALRGEALRHFNDGIGLLQQGQFEAARQRFTLADKLEPGNAEILNQIGITFYARFDLPMAEQYYRRALGADSGFALGHYNLACVLARQKRIPLAMRSLRAAVDNGFSAVGEMDSDTDLDPLRRDPNYREIRAAAQRNAR